MDFVPEVAPIPGSRISGYRNSSPRLISAARQLGQHGRRIVRGVETRGFPNVEVATTTPGRSAGTTSLKNGRANVPI